MDIVAVTIGCSWVLCGLLMIGLSIPLVQGRIGPNRFYGVRFPESFHSESAWYAINRYGGRRLMIWAVPLLIVGIASFFLHVQGHAGLAWLLGFGPLVFVLIPGW